MRMHTTAWPSHFTRMPSRYQRNPDTLVVECTPWLVFTCSAHLDLHSAPRKMGFGQPLWLCSIARVTRYSILLEEKPPSAATSSMDVPPPTSDSKASTSGKQQELRPRFVLSQSERADRAQPWASVSAGTQGLGISTHWAKRIAREVLRPPSVNTVRFLNRLREGLRRWLEKLHKKIEENRDVLLIVVALLW